MTLREVLELLGFVFTVAGAVGGAFMGAKIAIAHLEERVGQSERFIDELRKMKHLKVDPYLGSVDSDLPNTIDILKERMDRWEKSR